MRRAILVILAVCLVVIAGLTLEAVEQVANLSVGGGRVRNVHPRVLVMTSGDVMAVWESGSSKSDNDIVYRIWKKRVNVWHPPLGVAPFVVAKGVRNAQYPQLVEDLDGIVHMSFMDGDASYNRDVYYCYYRDGSWSGAVNVCPTAVNSAWPRISLDLEEERLYISWQHVWNNRFDGKDIVYVTKKLGANVWSGIKRLSNTPGRQSIHQATVCVGGRLVGVWMDGYSERDVWGLRNGWVNDSNGNRGEGVLAGPVAVHQPQWPDLATDSEGNILGIFSRRDAPLEFISKPVNQVDWRTGFLADGGGITFFGVTVARNDVAYCMYRRNVGNGYLPVMIRFDGEFVSEPEVLDHSAIRPVVWLGHMDIDVSLGGKIHMAWSAGQPSHVPTAIYYARQGRHPEAPEVSITVIRGVNRRFELRGAREAGNSGLRHQCWYVPALGIWACGDRLELQLPDNRQYKVYYIVGDGNNLYGCAETVLEAGAFPRASRRDKVLLPRRKDRG